MARHHRSDYLQRLNRVLEHIQRHPDADLSLTALARVAHFSPFHFHRIFRTHTGQTLQAFVSRSRLERALFVMRTSPRKRLAQVAVECGFESPSTFSKAFRSAFGVSPSRADVTVLASRPADFPLSAPVASSEPRRWRVTVRPREAMDIAYVRVTGGYLNPQALVDGYLELQAWIDRTGLSRQHSSLIGMSMDDPDITPLSECRYDFCCTVPPSLPRSAGINRPTVPAARWASVRCVGGLQDVDDAWTHLFRNWLPASGWQAAPLPAMEIFRQRPEEIGWDRFDLDCCLPVVPLIPG